MTGKQSDDKVRDVQNLRASGAAGPHKDKRTKRNRTRSEQNRRAIEEDDD